MTAEHGPGDPHEDGLPEGHPLKALEGGYFPGGEGLSLRAFEATPPPDTSELTDEQAEPITMDIGE